MKYINLMNRFWSLNRQVAFEPADSHLYGCLLDYFNGKGTGEVWPESAPLTDGALAMLAGVNVKTMDRARNRLVERGLITVTKLGQGSRAGSVYAIGSTSPTTYPVTSPTTYPKKGEVNGKHTPQHTPPLLPQHTPRHTPKREKFYIYKEFHTPDRETIDKILFVASRDDSIVRNAILHLVRHKKKPPKLRKAPPAIPFDVWWDLYGKKRDRAECEVRWNKLTDADREAIMLHTAEYFRVTPKQFRKDPIRYLKKASWTDEVINPDQSERRADSGTGGARVRNGGRQSISECGEELDRLSEQYFGA